MNRYTVTTKQSRIKLDANEHPYGVHPDLLEPLRRAISGVDCARYPDPSSFGVRKRVGEYLGASPEQVVVGNGSNEVMAFIANAFSRDIDRVVIPRPTFGMYRVVAGREGLPVEEIPTGEGFGLDPDVVRESVSGGGAMMFLCMPNNPTGNYFCRDVVEAALDGGVEVLVIDEAYAEFGEGDFVDLASRDPRVIILRTLSKAFGLAGVRVGYCVAHPDTADLIDAARAPYNVSGYAQAAAEVLLDGAEVQLGSVAAVKRSLGELYGDLRSIPGISPLPSRTNFLLFGVCPEEFGLSSSGLWSALGERGISVRRFPDEPVLEGYLRVSIGLPPENEEFVDAVRELGGD